VARRFEVLRPHLTEFQRRLWLGTEAAELGSDGVAVVAHAAGVAADTVRRGRAEADGGVELSAGRSRKPGGGRKRAESHDPGLIAAFESRVSTCLCKEGGGITGLSGSRRSGNVGFG